MAEERGFEPRHRVTDLRAFQARPFNHLGIPANLPNYSSTLLQKKDIFRIIVVVINNHGSNNKIKIS